MVNLFYDHEIAVVQKALSNMSFGMSDAPGKPEPAPPDKALPILKPRKWWDILIEQIINSAIIGGIAGISSLIAGTQSWKPAAIAFGIAALVELRKYRNLG